MKIEPVAIVDSREQTPWVFPNLPVEVGTLAAGDYSVNNLEHLVSVERKSLPDLLSCVGTARDRFKRKLQRLRAYRFPKRWSTRSELSYAGTCKSSMQHYQQPDHARMRTIANNLSGFQAIGDLRMPA